MSSLLRGMKAKMWPAPALSHVLHTAEHYSKETCVWPLSSQKGNIPQPCYLFSKDCSAGAVMINNIQGTTTPDKNVLPAVRDEGQDVARCIVKEVKDSGSFVPRLAWPSVFFLLLAAAGLFLVASARFLGRLLPRRARPWAAVLATLVTGAVFLLWCLTDLGTAATFRDERPLWWFLGYILEPAHRRMLLLQWPLLLIAGVVGADHLSRRLAAKSKGCPSNRDKHFVRKSFHALAIALFAPPLFEGLAPFLSLSLLIASLLFLALEACRFHQTPGLAPLLDSYLGQYLDKREDIARGDLVLTHLYLLLGCALPIWLERSLVEPRCPDAGAALRQWAGLLLIGAPGHRLATLARPLSASSSAGYSPSELFWTFMLRLL
ncbi:Dolk [Symbiodinium natans]|uniref:dolichol kinase n=1 Tax=Symbiodinium natans TaxID=878477 RepID=A0A812LLT4_9DINO|nr:Dolk [Symbiodinium natans]